MTTVIARLRSRWLSSAFVRNTGKLAGGTAVAQLITLVAAPILTRLYSPEGFGILGVFTSFLSILAITATLRYELAIPLAESEDEAAGVAAASLLFTTALGTAVAIAAYLIGETVLVALNSSQLLPYVWLLPISVLLVGAYQTLNYWAIRDRSFGRIAKTKLAQGAASVSTQLALGLVGVGPLGLLMGHVLGQSAGIMTLARDLPTRTIRQVSRGFLASTMHRFRRFPYFAAPGALLNSATSQAPVLIFAALYGPVVAGLFALTQRIVGLPIQFIGNSVNQVFFAEVAQLRRTDPTRVAVRFLQVSGSLALLAVVPALVLLAFGPQLFSFVFGDDWIEAGRFARVLAPMLILQFSVGPTAHLNILERQELNLLWNVVRAVLVAGAFVISSSLGLQAQATVTLYAAAMSVSYLLMAALWLFAATRSSKEQLAE